MFYNALFTFCVEQPFEETQLCVAPQRRSELLPCLHNTDLCVEAGNPPSIALGLCWPLDFTFNFVLRGRSVVIL